jgi:hypothetical protein
LAVGDNTVIMGIGKFEYHVNGVEDEMDISPFIENDRTFLPLRFVAQNLDCRVTWMNETREILIVYTLPG